jgi:tripartite ATP-independent transporter DctP family solute receptor
MEHPFTGQTKPATRRRFLIGGEATLVGTLCGSGAPARAQSLRANLNHEMTGTIVDRAVQRLAQTARERSGGRISIIVHSRGEMGGERAMFDLMQAGAIEMGVSGAVIISAIAPEYGMLDVPYLIGTPEHLARVVRGEVGEALRRTVLQRKGIRIIGHMDRAPRHLTTRGRAVRTPSDLRGLKIRVREIPVQVEAFRLLGASPVPMAFGEVYTALQTGVIDAQENLLDIILGSSFNEVQDHVILTGHVREVQWLIVSERWWSGLAAGDRALIQAAADEAMAWGQGEVYAPDARLVAEARAKGMTIIELTAEKRAAFQRGVADLPKQFDRVWKPGLFDTIVAATPR